MSEISGQRRDEAWSRPGDGRVASNCGPTLVHTPTPTTPSAALSIPSRVMCIFTLYFITISSLFKDGIGVLHFNHAVMCEWGKEWGLWGDRNISSVTALEFPYFLIQYLLSFLCFALSSLIKIWTTSPKLKINGCFSPSSCQYQIITKVFIFPNTL